MGEEEGAAGSSVGSVLTGNRALSLGRGQAQLVHAREPGPGTACRGASARNSHQEHPVAQGLGLVPSQQGQEWQLFGVGV